MFHNNQNDLLEMQEFAQLGNDVVAYMREITADEIKEKFPGTDELKSGETYWALFAADGTPLVLANNQQHVSNEAFLSDLKTILPN